MISETASNKLKNDDNRQSKSPIQTFIFKNLISMNGMNGSFGFITFIVFSIQSFCIVYSLLYPISWDNGFTDWLSSITNAVLLQTYLYRNTTALYTFSALILCCIGGFVLAGVLRNTSQRAWSGLTLKLSNLLFNFMAGVAYLPVMSMYGSFLSCHRLAFGIGGGIKLEKESSSCWSGDHLAHAIVSLVFMLLAILLALVRQVFLAETVAYDTTVLSRAHGRIDGFEVAAMGFLTLLTSSLSGTMKDSVAAMWVYNIFCLVLTVILACLHILYGPYYFRWFQYLKTMVTTLLAWSCLAVVIMQLAPSEGYESVMFLYVSGFFIALVSAWIHGNRMQRLEGKLLEQLKNVYEAEIHVRLKLQKGGSFWTRFSSIVAGVKPDASDQTFIDGNNDYRLLLKQFSGSPLIYIVYGNFLFGKCNHNYCLNVFSRVRSMQNVPMDVKYKIYKRSALIDDLYSRVRGTIEVRRYFRYLELNKETEILQMKFAGKKLIFLYELKKASNGSAEKINQHGRMVYDLLQSIQSNYAEMFSINPKSKVIRKYASFVSNILDNKKLTNALVDFADKLDAQNTDLQQQPNTKLISTQAAMFDDRNAVFVLSADESRLGEILECNLGAVDMFEFTAASEIIGSNINTMMPSPFSENHHSFLRKYLETGFTSVLDIVRTVYAKNKHGFIFEVHLYVRQVIDIKGDLNFVGVMQRKEEQPTLMIIDPKGYLVALSADCPDKFKLTRDGGDSVESLMERLRSIHVSQILTNWDTNQQSYRKEQGLSVEIMGMNLHVKVQELAFIKSQFSLVEMWTTSGEHTLKQSRLEIASMGVLTEDQTKSVVTTSIKSGISNKNNKLITHQNSFSADGEDLAMVNTVSNSSHKFRKIMSDYSETLMSREHSTDRIQKLMFRMLLLAFIIWMVSSNFAISSRFQKLTDVLFSLTGTGTQIFEAHRVYTSVRNLQILRGCHEGNNISICATLKNIPLTSATVDEARTIMALSSESYRSSFEFVMERLVAQLGDDEIYKTLGPRFFLTTENYVQLDEQKFIGLDSINFVEATQYFSVGSHYMAKTNNLPYFFSTDQGSVEMYVPDNMLQISDYAYNRYLLFVLENAEMILIYLRFTGPLYENIYLSRILGLQGAIIIISIVPAVMICLALSVYILPTLGKLVSWEIDIIYVLKSLPNLLLNWWYKSLVKRLEAESREDEEGVNAELFIQLQQVDAAGDLAEMKSEKKTGSSSTNPKKIKKELTSEDAVNKKLTFYKGLRSMASTLTIWKLILTGILLAAIPLSSLIMLVQMNQCYNLAHYVEWTNRILMRMTMSHHAYRESILYYTSGPEYSDLGWKYLLDARLSWDLLVVQHRYLVYGREKSVGEQGDIYTSILTQDVDGLGNMATYRELFFGNACSSSEEVNRILLHLKGTCAQFKDGILTFGLNQALIAYEQEMLMIHNALLRNATTTPEDQQFLSSKIIGVEEMLYEITSLMFSLREQLKSVVATSNYISTQIIQPIQIAAAFIGSLIAYLKIFMPIMREIEVQVRAMNGLLTIFESSFDSTIEPNPPVPEDETQEDSQQIQKKIKKTADLNGIDDSQKVEMSEVVINSNPMINMTEKKIEFRANDSDSDHDFTPEDQQNQQENQEQTIM